MPKLAPHPSPYAIVEVVRRFHEPVSTKQIARQLPGTIVLRTLQYRIAKLVAEGRLTVVGQARSRRYSIGHSQPEKVSKQSSATKDGYAIPLSRDAKEIRADVSRPVSARLPVGYQFQLLDDYRPNVSEYLSPALKSELAGVGQLVPAELPAGTYLRQVLGRLLIDLSWNSSRLEGNTYSLLETERLLELGESAEGKDAREAQMILNHKAAIEMLAEQVDDLDFNRYTICNLHALLSDNLLADSAACGRLRARAVGIQGTTFHPLELPSAIDERFQQVLDTLKEIEDAFEQAFFSMVHLPYLQPFEDVNKRVSRLAANIPLVKQNLCPLSFIDVPQEDYVNGLIGIYELNRVEYLRDVFVWAYRRSCARYSAVRQSLGEPDPFRLKYRSQVRQFVADVVRGRMDKRSAVIWITKNAQKVVPTIDRSKFREVVEAELRGLHEGNIARHRLRPSEFADWIPGWK